MLIFSLRVTFVVIYFSVFLFLSDSDSVAHVGFFVKTHMVNSDFLRAPEPFYGFKSIFDGSVSYQHRQETGEVYDFKQRVEFSLGYLERDLFVAGDTNGFQHLLNTYIDVGSKLASGCPFSLRLMFESVNVDVRMDQRQIMLV